MKGKPSADTGSLDMLLDTMCNTFGGICFIALMVAIISASLPSEQDSSDNSETVSEQMIVDKETARLVRERDELKSAIEIQKSFLAQNTNSNATALSATRLTTKITSSAAELDKLKNKKLELEDKLAKVTTDISYSSREAMRLDRLLKDLEEKLGKPGNVKNRAVRTPVERELSGYKTLDVWIRNGKLYDIANDSHVTRVTKDGINGLEMDVKIKPGAGFYIDKAFINSHEYLQLIDMLKDKVYMRIFCDATSFTQLCELRDDLIRRRKMYNWHVHEQQELHFVEGYDGRVQ